MVLTDKDILGALEKGELIIDPAPSARSYSSTSVDLKLGKNIQVWKEPPPKGVEPQVIVPADPDFNCTDIIKACSDLIEIPACGYVMEPRTFILGWTEEYVELINDSHIAARVEGKSSIARLGVGVHITAPTIHAGFRGEIQLEMFNLGPHRIRLKPGMRICQLIFEKTTGAADHPYEGQFSGQRGRE
ncbi:MAG TPA: dCTP deaminase [Fimbriimonadaceae bacterium]|nr:dCTP deaminase [Fimbriimonadaceae bacterium]